MSTEDRKQDFFQGPASALVVGISEYSNGVAPGQKLNPGEVTRLRCAAQDAKDFATFLENHGVSPDCIHTLIDTEATLRNIRKGFAKLRDACDAEDEKRKPLVFVFFSGHGMSDVKDRGYLLPCEGERNDLDGTAISNDEFQLYVKSVKTNRLVVFLDACHSGAMGIAGAMGAFPSYTLPGLGEGGARCLIASCEKDQISWEGQQNNGIFTENLLQILENGIEEDVDYINVYQLVDALQKRVTAAAKAIRDAKQVPTVSMSNATGLVLAVNRWKQAKVIRENEKKGRYLDLVEHELDPKLVPAKPSIVMKLLDYLEIGAKQPGHNQFYELFESEFAVCDGEPTPEQLQITCGLLCSAHKRAMDSNKAGSSSRSQTRSQSADQFTTVPKSVISEKLAQAPIRIPSFQDQKLRHELSAEDQEYVLEPIRDKVGFWDVERWLIEGLRQPTCEADFSQLIRKVAKKKRGSASELPEEVEEVLNEVVQRFLQKLTIRSTVAIRQ